MKDFTLGHVAYTLHLGGPKTLTELREWTGRTTAELQRLLARLRQNREVYWARGRWRPYPVVVPVRRRPRIRIDWRRA